MALKKNILTPEQRKKISDTLKRKGIKPPTRTGISPWNKGKVWSEETKEKMRIAKLGKKSARSKDGLNSFRKKMTGVNHPNWKGGMSTVNEKIRKSFEYKLWRTAVFERDNYTCVWCGSKSSKKNAVILNADHIKPFAYFPELRFAIDNGRTLCKKCHLTTDTYGSKIKKLYD